MELDYNAVFGIEQGENEPAPAQQDTPDTSSDAHSEEEAGQDAEIDAGEKEAEPAEQSAEENKKQAAARRKRERDAEIAKARAEAADEAYRSMGMENPYTGKPITNKAEFDAWKQQEAAEKRGHIAESAGMTGEEFDDFINNLPQVKAAVKQNQRMMIEEQVGLINKLDPSIKTFEDLYNREDYKDIYDTVQKTGVSIVEAFKLVNFDRLTQSAAAASRQAAINSANSKDHLSTTSQRGAGALTVPADVKEIYRALNPGITDAEIQQHYNKYHKQ